MASTYTDKSQPAPFTHTADLLKLPIELRAQVYSYIFQGDRVRFLDRQTRIPCQYHLSGHHDERPYTPLLSIQLTNKAFLTDWCLYTEFLRTVTLSVHGLVDLSDLQRRLGSDLLKSVRHVAVRKTPDPNPVHLLEYWGRKSRRVCRARHCNQKWTDVTVDALVSTFPGLRSLTTAPSSSYGVCVVDINRRDFRYSLQDLVEAHEYLRRRGRQQQQQHNHHQKNDRSASPEALRQYDGFPPPLSLSNLRQLCRSPEDRHHVILNDFSLTLHRYLHRTLQLYDPTWFCSFLGRAAFFGIDVHYTLQLAFSRDRDLISPSYTDRIPWGSTLLPPGDEEEDEDVVDNVSVSVAEGVVWLCVAGKKYGFVQRRGLNWIGVGFPHAAVAVAVAADMAEGGRWDSGSRNGGDDEDRGREGEGRKKWKRARLDTDTGTDLPNLV